MRFKEFDQFVAFYYTNDLKATANFYTQKIGLELALDQGSCQIFRVNDKSFIGFCENRKKLPAPDTCIITFVTEFVDEVFEDLKQTGIEIIKAPAFNPDYNIYHCFIKDPNGYKVEIQKFLDPRWN